MLMSKPKKYRNVCGDRIRKVRLLASPPITQEDLAARLAAKGLNIDQAAISRIESKTRYLTDYELISIAKALKISTSLLLE